MSCKSCEDTERFPAYGGAPSIQVGLGCRGVANVQVDKKHWPEYFVPDPESEGHGWYMYCPKCGRGDVRRKKKDDVIEVERRPGESNDEFQSRVQAAADEHVRQSAIGAGVFRSFELFSPGQQEFLKSLGVRVEKHGSTQAVFNDAADSARDRLRRWRTCLELLVREDPTSDTMSKVTQVVNNDDI